MSAIKWIGGFLGWIFLGPLGGLIGFGLGAIIDGSIKAAGRVDANDANRYDTSGNPYSGGTRYSTRPGTSYAEATRNTFMASLLVLATAVAKSDGKFLKSELELMKTFIRDNFGEDSVGEALQIIKRLSQQDIDVSSVGGQIRTYMNYSQRMQLFHFLFELANVDGTYSKSEDDCLRRIAFSIGLSDSDRDSMMNMNNPEDVAAAYKILGTNVDMSNDEVTKAYRRMAMKYHPDKVSTLGVDVQKAAEEKFKNINAAYETIKKSRNMN
ncbi:MAG: molecular chaperone DjiA [Bacteroidales bacterium]|jgi:DnaJ like chaperone protein|nr:molecular chaperone DjiA [Bacteroidales bacterium]MCI2122273.1 molecular chaperone DjiA [Bacteroidales bacterium]MCI2144654.1 molecular chaperone DjiA [Bacteroidales bacterium]